MTKVFFLTAILFLILSCDNQQKKNNPTNEISTKINSARILETKSDESKNICDSIYPNKGYKVTITLFDSTNLNEEIPNTLFILSKLKNGNYLPIFTDSIFSFVREIRFEDFNNDKVKDILIQNYSDVRSNWTYNLYLVDTVHNNLKKIKGFQEIKNPNYLPKYDLINNLVMSGKNWTNFYQIVGDSIKDYNLVIYDDQNDDVKFDLEIKKAIKKILSNSKKIN